MIRFQLADPGRVHLRVAYSPLWECVASVRAHADPAARTPLGPWAACAAPAPGAALLAALVAADGGYIPDFLAPPPARAGVSFDDELDRLRRTPAERVQAEVARTAAAPSGRAAAALLARWTGDAAGLRDALADALDRHWRASLAPHWPRLAALLEGEVLARARALAVDGAAALLGALGHDVAPRHADGRIVAVDVASPQEGTVVLDDGELLLVPSVFAWPRVFTVHDPAWRASIYFPARGVGALWDDAAGAAAARATDPLALLAGAGRAAVLRALRAPATTSELAVRLGAAPASVSGHLQRLRRAGLLEATRIGRRVYYRTSARGEALLAAMT